MPVCLTAEDLGLLFLWMVTHPSGKKNLLLLELFSSVSLDDLFTKLQAFVAKPSCCVLSCEKTPLHHVGFHQQAPKAHPDGVWLHSWERWRAGSYLSAFCFYCLNEDCYLCLLSWDQALEQDTATCVTGRTQKQTRTHTEHKRNVRAQWKQTQQWNSIASCAKLDCWTWCSLVLIRVMWEETDGIKRHNKAVLTPDPSFCC